MQTTRILIAIDVPTGQLTEVYGGYSADSIAVDLNASLEARLQEFFPGENGYATPVNVTAVVVDFHTTDDDDAVPAITASALGGVYAVGIEGVEEPLPI